jgi:hypothetical protein
MMTSLSRRAASGALLGAIVALTGMAACGGSSTTVPAPDVMACGPGTVLNHGECVVAGDANAMTNQDALSSADSPSSSMSDTADALGLMDVLEEREGSFDVNLDTSPSGPDPCPSGGAITSCDPQCDADPRVISLCAMSACANSAIPFLIRPQQPQVLIRTPNAPGSASGCVAQCPSGGLAYAIGFSLTQSYPLSIRVSAPWMILTSATSSTPYCQDSGAQPPTSCVTIPNNFSGWFDIVTTDPNAPARNVEVQIISPDAGACP